MFTDCGIIQFRCDFKFCVEASGSFITQETQEALLEAQARATTQYCRVSRKDPDYIFTPSVKEQLTRSLKTALSWNKTLVTVE